MSKRNKYLVSYVNDKEVVVGRDVYGMIKYIIPYTMSEIKKEFVTRGKSSYKKVVYKLVKVKEIE
jgi:hypothetical protein